MGRRWVDLANQNGANGWKKTIRTTVYGWDASIYGATVRYSVLLWCLSVLQHEPSKDQLSPAYSVDIADCKSAAIPWRGPEMCAE